jgi:hypothetical protein
MIADIPTVSTIWVHIRVGTRSQERPPDRLPDCTLAGFVLTMVGTATSTDRNCCTSLSRADRHPALAPELAQPRTLYARTTWRQSRTPSLSACERTGFSTMDRCLAYAEQQRSVTAAAWGLDVPGHHNTSPCDLDARQGAVGVSLRAPGQIPGQPLVPQRHALLADGPIVDLGIGNHGCQVTPLHAEVESEAEPVDLISACTPAILLRTVDTAPVGKCSDACQAEQVCTCSAWHLTRLFPSEDAASAEDQRQVDCIVRHV